MSKVINSERKVIYVAGRVGLDVKSAYNRFSVVSHYILDQQNIPINPLWLTYPVWKCLGNDGINYASITLPLVNVADELWIINTEDLSDSCGTKQEFNLFSKTSRPIFLVYILGPDDLRFRKLDQQSVLSWEDLLEIARDQRKNPATE